MITLLDAVEYNKQFPSFQIPNVNTRRNVKVGQFVKLAFEGGEYCERMWIKITHATQDDYVGTLANTPTCNEYTDLLAEPIHFKPENILAIEY